MVPYSPDFDLVRAKILATSGAANQAVSLFQSNLQDRRYISESAQRYGLAVAFLRVGNVDAATKELSWLRANSPSHPFLLALRPILRRHAIIQSKPQKPTKQA